MFPNNILFPLLIVIIISILKNANSIQTHQESSSISETSSNQLLLETRCLQCIRNVSSQLGGADVNKRCESYYCGPLQISYTYWSEAGKPGNNQGAKDFEKCARDKQCSEQTVRNYFKKYKRDCNNDGAIDCLDMAALHKAGPSACSSDWFYKSRYWLAFNKTTCMSDPSNTNLEANDSDKFDSYNTRNQNRVTKNQSLTSDCLDCICDAVSGCNTSVNNCGSGTVCGPFAISQAYWRDGKKPGASWTACSRTKECSSVTIKNYMEKYKRDCNDDGFITCEDYAAIHRRGPRACSNKDLFKDHYWNKFLACRANQMPSKDVNMVKVNENSDSDQNLLSSRVEQQPTMTSTQAAPTMMHDLAPASPTAPETTPSSLPASSSLHHEYSPMPSETTKRERFRPDHHHNHQLHEQQQLFVKVERATTPAPTTTKAQLPNEQDYHGTRQTVVKSHQDPKKQSSSMDYDIPLILVRAPSSGWTQQQTNSPTTTASTQSSTIPMVPLSESHSKQSNASKKPQITDSMQSSQRPENEHVGDQPNMQQKGEQQQQQNYPATTLDAQPVPTNEDNDYPVSDLNSHGGANFDKVVTGIVGNPDFTKSYPPVPPEIILPEVNRQDEEEQSLAMSGAASQVISSNKPLQQRINTNHSKGPVKTNQIMLPQQSKGTTVIANKNQVDQKAATINPIQIRSQTIQSHQQQIESSTVEQPIYNLDPVNMSSLFGSGDIGLNESSGRIAEECLECICDASSNCDTSVQCISKQRDKNRCGLYMISWNQFQESEIASLKPDLGDDKFYYECTTNRNCAEKLIHLYIEKHQKDCNNDGKIDCYDIAAIHRVGPSQCNSGKFLQSQYWKDFNICYTTDRLMTTTTTIASPPPSSTSPAYSSLLSR